MYLMHVVDCIMGRCRSVMADLVYTLLSVLSSPAKKLLSALVLQNICVSGTVCCFAMIFLQTWLHRCNKASACDRDTVYAFGHALDVG